MSDGVPLDRRQQPRVGVPGRARITAAGQTHELAIRDLSRTGARLVGGAPVFEQQRVTVELALEDATVKIAAEVIRIDHQNSQIAIAFRDLDAPARQTIERAIDLLIRRVQGESAPTVIVLHAQADIRDALERDLAQLGRATRACTSMLETTWALNDPALRCEVLIVAGELGDESLAALLRHVADEHPDIRRVVLFSDHLQSIDKAAAGLITAILRTPIRIRALARALQIEDADSSTALILPSDDSP